MIDHALGRPSPSWKRLQVILVILFWGALLRRGPKDGVGVFKRLNERLARFSPWQIAVGLLTCSYAFKNVQHILGLAAPEPLSRLYSRNYYRATYVVTALDAGYATAMHVRPHWLREILSLLFFFYYLVYADDGEEKVRRYRAFCSIEFMRVTWNKTSSPLIRWATYPLRGKTKMHRRFAIDRPPKSAYARPMMVELYFEGTEEELKASTELVFDVPGGGFIAQAPIQHDERLIRWAKRLKRPVLSLDYCKAPEFPYPYAIYEVMDVYKLVVQTNGGVIGLQPAIPLRIVMSGDSAGGNLSAACLFKLMELPANEQIPLPIGLLFSYPALNFNFTSWMPREDLRVLKQEESTAALASIASAKEHLSHSSPLSVVGDDRRAARKRRNKSWSRSFGLRSPTMRPSALKMTPTKPTKPAARFALGAESGDDDEDSDPEETRALAERVKEPSFMESVDVQPDGSRDPSTPHFTRLTMSSRTSYFSDRILTPTMMRAMAILYIGPSQVDLAKNYYISPILAPNHLLARMPRLHIVCGEKDPLVDDSLVFAGRVREARRLASGSKDPLEDIGHVTLKLVEGWSHAFLQMITLMPGVGQHIDTLADTIADEFARAPMSAPALQLSSAVHERPNAPTPPLPGLVETADLLRRRRQEAVDGISLTPSGQVAKTEEKRDQSPAGSGKLRGVDGSGD